MGEYKHSKLWIHNSRFCIKQYVGNVISHFFGTENVKRKPKIGFFLLIMTIFWIFSKSMLKSFSVPYTIIIIVLKQLIPPIKELAYSLNRQMSGY